MSVQTLYQEAIKFAAAKHADQEQTIKDSNIPYVVHLSNVTMEVMIAATYTPNFDLPFAVPIALLHDTLEDTATEFDEIHKQFGMEVAKAVLALTKNANLPKQEQIPDSIQRIKQLQTEVWAIKLADRITNMQVPPPSWDLDKRKQYLADAITILKELKEGNHYLAQRLDTKIHEYPRYLIEVPEHVS